MKDKFIPAETGESIVFEGKIIKRGDPGFDEAVRAVADRATHPEEEKVKIDPGYLEEAGLDDAGKEQLKDKYKRIAAGEREERGLTKTDQMMEAGLLSAERVIQEALSDLKLERSLADEESMKVLDAKEDALTRIMETSRQDRPLKRRYVETKQLVDEIAGAPGASGELLLVLTNVRRSLTES